MTANVAISLGWNAIDAQVELGGAGIPEDGADEMLAALGHAPAPDGVWLRC